MIQLSYKFGGFLVRNWSGGYTYGFELWHGGTRTFYDVQGQAGVWDVITENKPFEIIIYGFHFFISSNKGSIFYTIPD